MNSNEMIDVDLPSLQSIQLGKWALCGIENNYLCSLKMKSREEMIRKELLCRSSGFSIPQFYR